MNQKIDWRKYIIVFIITSFLFVTASYLSNYFGDRKVAELRDIQNKIALDILSSETQYSLLADSSCKNVNYSILSEELGDLGQKLEWSEENLGNTEEVEFLRKYYSLLEIKDYLLMKKVSARCGEKYAFVLYFYTTADYCSECKKAGFVLSSLRDKYPELRVYSFDYSTDLSAVETMLKIYKIEDTKLPAMVLDDEVLTGYRPIDELEAKIQKTFGLEPPTEKETIEE